MSKHSSGETINRGSAAKPDADRAEREDDIARNAKVRGEDPSPGDHERGERSVAGAANEADRETRDRAS